MAFEVITLIPAALMNGWKGFMNLVERGKRVSDEQRAHSIEEMQDFYDELNKIQNNQLKKSAQARDLVSSIIAQFAATDDVSLQREYNRIHKKEREQLARMLANAYNHAVITHDQYKIDAPDVEYQSMIADIKMHSPRIIQFCNARKLDELV